MAAEERVFARQAVFAAREAKTTIRLGGQFSAARAGVPTSGPLSVFDAARVIVVVCAELQMWCSSG